MVSLPASSLVPALAVMAVLSACASGSPAPGDGSSAPGDSPAVAVVRGLCLAAGQSATSPGQARDTFAERAHDQLHQLAGAVSEVDRSLAASLLEAKARVEMGLADPEAGQLDVDLGQLARAAAEAYQALGREPAGGLEDCR